MSESILTSTKKMLGITADYTAFDLDVITHINTAFSILNQLGVGPVEGFSITGTSETWDDYLGTESNLNNVKTYVFLKTKMIFDPPQNSSTSNAYDKQIQELEWRINGMVDYYQE